MASFVDESAHWYTIEGEPRHDATLRQARKDNLLPSVTTVGRVLDKPQLNKWKYRRILETAKDRWMEATHMDMSEFTDLVTEEAFKPSADGRERGTEFHEHFAAAILDPAYPLAEKEPALKGLARWIEAHIRPYPSEIPMRVEQVVVHRELGWAGTVDYCGPFYPHAEVSMTPLLAIIDLKNRDVKPSGRDPFYDEDVQQLAAYREAAADFWGVRAEVLVSVVNGTNPENPGTWMRIWPESSEGRVLGARDAGALFRHSYQIWRLQKRFPYVDARQAQLFEDLIEEAGA